MSSGGFAGLVRQRLNRRELLAVCGIAGATGIYGGKRLLLAHPAAVAPTQNSSVRISTALQVPSNSRVDTSVRFSVRPIEKSVAQYTKSVVMRPGADRVELVPVEGPGPYVLEMIGFGERINFALTVLEGYRCEFAVLQGPGSGIRITQFACSLNEDAPSTDFRRSFSDLQLALQEGQTPAKTILAQLSDWKYSDPVALAVETHLRSFQKDQHAFRKAAERLAGEHSRLPDGHVALARTGDPYAQPDHQNAAAAYRRALDLGLPILMPFLEMLWEGVRRYEIKHDRIGLLEKVFRSRLTGILWSAWNPDLM
jgi:hypothetical protein